MERMPRESSFSMSGLRMPQLSSEMDSLWSLR